MTESSSKPSGVNLSVLGGSGHQSAWHRDFLPEEGLFAAQLYQRIRDEDPIVGGVFLSLESMFRRVEWTEVPAEDSEAAQGWATFLAECRQDMSHTWPAFIAEALSMLVHGWAYFEVVYKIRCGPEQADPAYRSRFTDGRVGWRKFAHRPQRTLNKWEYDGDGGIQGLWQNSGNGRGNVFIPIQKALHFRTTEAGGHPEGRSLLVNARRSFRFQTRLEEFEAVGIERDLAGLPDIQVPVELLGGNLTPEAQATLQHMKNIGANLRNDEQAYIVRPSEEYVVQEVDERTGQVKHVRLPTGYKVSLMTSGGQRAFDTDKVIRRYSQRISASLLATFLLLGGSEGKGAQALSSDLTDLFELAGTGILDGITEVINRFAVGNLMRLNGVPPALWPRLEHGGLSDAALQQLLNQVKTLMDAGAVTHDENLETNLRSRLNLPARMEGTNTGDF
ncbi:phage portal protein family protein [Deinococcus hohokamensis]|uniref:Portal protein n=1 Tax=Deinococcus hohokamensis TaxID=309883 RepID=A0ABV9I492_9DEIO